MPNIKTNCLLFWILALFVSAFVKRVIVKNLVLFIDIVVMFFDVCLDPFCSPA